MPYVHIPNGVVTDEESFHSAPESAVTAIAELKKKGKFVLMYLGGFSKANAIDDLMAAAPLLPESVQLVLVGDGPLKAEYEKQAAESGLGNVTLLPLVTKLQVNKTLSLADALYIGAKKSRLYAYGVGMNKIFDYMLSGRPVLYAIESSNNPVSDADCGVTANAEDPVSIAGAAAALAAMPAEELVRMGENGRSYVLENNDYKKLAVRFTKTLEALRQNPEAG